MNYVLVYYIISDSYRYDPCMRCVAGDFLLLIQGHDCWWWLCFLAPSSGSRLNLDDYWIMLPAIDYQISTIFILSGHWRGFFLWNLWGSSRILEVITDAPDDAWDSRILFFWRRILSLFQESLSLSLGRESQRCPSIKAVESWWRNPATRLQNEPQDGRRQRRPSPHANRPGAALPVDTVSRELRQRFE